MTPHEKNFGEKSSASLWAQYCHTPKKYGHILATISELGYFGLIVSNPRGFEASKFSLKLN